MYKTIAQVNKKIFFKKGDLVKVIALTKKTGRICIVVEDGNLDTTIVLEPSGKKSIALTDSLGLIQTFNKKKL